MALIGFNNVRLLTVPAPVLELEACYSHRVSPANGPEVRIPVPDAGMLSKFRISVPTNSLDVPTIVSLLVSGTPVSQITVPAGTTGDWLASMLSWPVSGGDEISFGLSALGASGGIAMICGSVRYDPA